MNGHVGRAHSKIGPSSSNRWMTCPASVRLSAGLPNPTNKYAEEGTAAHELAEECLVEDLPAKNYVGTVFNKHIVTEEMAEAVQVYLDAIRERAGEGKQIYIEERFSLPEIHPNLFGTNDCCIAEPFGKLVVADYKHGTGIVEAKDNTQLMIYALGASHGLEFTEIELMIVQPRAAHPEGPVRTWTITPDQLAKFAKTLKKAAAATDDADSPCNPTTVGCKYCLAAKTCDALKQQVYNIAKAEFDVIDDTISLPAPDTLSNGEIRRVLEGSALISSWVKEVQAHAHILAEKGEKIEGYKLVQKKANRKWKDESEVVEMFDGMFDDSDLYAPKKLRSPAQLEKIVGKADVAKLTIAPDNGTTLVLATDKRKEVMPVLASDEFDKLEEDFDI